MNLIHLRPNFFNNSSFLIILNDICCIFLLFVFLRIPFKNVLFGFNMKRKYFLCLSIFRVYCSYSNISSTINIIIALERCHEVYEENKQIMKLYKQKYYRTVSNSSGFIFYACSSLLSGVHA